MKITRLIWECSECGSRQMSVSFKPKKVFCECKKTFVHLKKENAKVRGTLKVIKRHRLINEVWHDLTHKANEDE